MLVCGIPTTILSFDSGLCYFPVSLPLPQLPASPKPSFQGALCSCHSVDTTSVNEMESFRARAICPDVSYELYDLAWPWRGDREPGLCRPAVPALVEGSNSEGRLSHWGTSPLVMKSCVLRSKNGLSVRSETMSMLSPRPGVNGTGDELGQFKRCILQGPLYVVNKWTQLSWCPVNGHQCTILGDFSQVVTSLRLLEKF